jgi:hypothetical protein
MKALCIPSRTTATATLAGAPPGLGRKADTSTNLRPTSAGNISIRSAPWQTMSTGPHQCETRSNLSADQFIVQRVLITAIVHAQELYRYVLLGIGHPLDAEQRRPERYRERLRRLP